MRDVAMYSFEAYSFRLFPPVSSTAVKDTYAPRRITSKKAAPTFNEILFIVSLTKASIDVGYH